MKVLAIDPGREKCGVAVVSPGEVWVQKVVECHDFLKVAKTFVKRYNVKSIVLGDGTGSREFFSEIRAALPECSIELIDEHLSSEEGRKRYWRSHRPRGWRRLLPVSIQLPPEPYDDYVAVILGERFLKKASRKE